jgi:hypothetical protein
MKHLFIIAFVFLNYFSAKADTVDSWIILVNGERVFECVSACSAKGVNIALLKSKVTLHPTDKITFICTKDSTFPSTTKVLTITDTAFRYVKTTMYVKPLQAFPIFDPEGNKAITISASDLKELHGIVIWYSEKRRKNNKIVESKKIALVYFE